MSTKYLIAISLLVIFGLSKEAFTQDLRCYVCDGIDCNDISELESVVCEDAPIVTTTEDPDVTTTEAPDVTTTEAPVVTTTEAPVVTTTEAPVVTTTEAPVVTTTEAPVVTTTEAPVVTTTEAPVVTTTEAPVVTTTEAPVVTTTEAPVVTTTEAPVVTTTEAPVVTTTEPPVVTTTEAPVVTTTLPPAPENPENPEIPAAILVRHPKVYFPYRRLLEESSTTWHCVKVEYNDDEGRKTKRDCKKIADADVHMRVCEELIDDDDKRISYCRVCNTDECNSAVMAKYSLALIPFLLVLSNVLNKLI